MRGGDRPRQLDPRCPPTIGTFRTAPPVASPILIASSSPENSRPRLRADEEVECRDQHDDEGYLF